MREAFFHILHFIPSVSYNELGVNMVFFLTPHQCDEQKTATFLVQIFVGHFMFLLTSPLITKADISLPPSLCVH